MAGEVLSIDLGSKSLAAEGAEPASAVLPNLASIYDTHCDYVFRCLRSLGVAPSHLDDAVQDVFMVVHQKLEGFDGKHPLRTWLYAIVIRVARKKRALLARHWAAEIDAASSLNTEDDAANKQGLRLAQRALLALDADKREVFVLLEIEQMSAPEAAEILGLPVNTVYSRLRLARLAFNQACERVRRNRVINPRGRHG